jgi:protein involved in polysaccharide export with SLBB domain
LCLIFEFDPCLIRVQSVAKKPWQRTCSSDEVKTGYKMVWRRLLLIVGCSLFCGCAAITNPVADGIPVRRVPEELLAPSKECTDPVPLALLRQPPPDVYRLAAGDVLGVYIEGIIGGALNQPLPVHVAPLLQPPGNHLYPSAMGYPIPVEDDGTIHLPQGGSLYVDGLSVGEARKAIRDLYIKKKVLKPDNDSVLVTLLNPRQHQVIVLREETAAWTPGPTGRNMSHRGTGQVVQLPAYENDVLHALAATGGLPAEDAVNQIIVFRDCFQDMAEAIPLAKQFEKHDSCKPAQLVTRTGKVTCIPLRLPKGELLHLDRDDTVLHTGDIVYLEPRNNEVFYTGGLLPPGVFEIPRDHDLDVIEAVSEVRGPLFNGAFGGSNLSGQLVQPGFGEPSPSLLTVVRKTPNGGQVAITVDLGKAMKEPQERLLVKAGDVLVLQEKPGEAVARWFSQSVFNFDMAWQVIRGNTAAGFIGISTPNRNLTNNNQFVTVP